MRTNVRLLAGWNGSRGPVCEMAARVTGSGGSQPGDLAVVVANEFARRLGRGRLAADVAPAGPRRGASRAQRRTRSRMEPRERHLDLERLVFSVGRHLKTDAKESLTAWTEASSILDDHGRAQFASEANANARSDPDVLDHWLQPYTHGAVPMSPRM